MKEQIKQLLNSKKAVNALIIALIALGALILASAYLPKGDKKKEEAGLSDDQYSAALEQKIAKIASDITGREASATVTLENGSEYIYLDTQKTGSDKSEQDYIIVKEEGGGENGLLVTEKMPQVRGVVVIAGGADKQQCEAIKESVMALLNLRSSKVCVLASADSAPTIQSEQN